MEILLGLLIGFAIGATGIGGGTLTAPVLILLMGFPPRSAVATALIFAAAVKVWASAEYLRKRLVDVRVLGYLLCGGVPGALAGAVILERSRLFRTNEWVLCAIGAVVMVSAVSSMVKVQLSTHTSKTRLRLLSFCALPIGLETGLSSSGSGALTTVILLRLTPLSTPQVVGTGLVFGMIVCALAGGIHAFSGACDWPALVRLLPSGILGSVLGVHACTALPKRVLRTSVLICAAAVGLSLVVKGVSSML